MAQAANITIFGICGSLRQASFNRAALHTAIALASQGVTIAEADIRAIPLYNEDVRAKGNPPAVAEFRKSIAAAEALLFATPQCNYSISGVVKNAIDWASRPPDKHFAGKPAAMMGARMGIHGTARSRYHQRQVCVALDMLPVNKPEVMIPAAQSKFDTAGKLTDEATRGFIAPSSWHCAGP